VYGAAWNETDDGARLTLLERCWADDATYTDPTASVTGREGLAAHIGQFQAERPGFRLELTSGVDEHGGRLRFAWRMLAPDGAEVLEGLDFGELDGSGRLSRIVGFFGALPGIA
jgi:hypothetical protein